MGGVIRSSKASNIFLDSKNLNKIYHNGEPVWEYREPSTYLYEPVQLDEDVLIAGSSTMAGMVQNLWSGFGPGQHHWYPLFRANYTGNFSTEVQGVTLPGTGTATTLGRVPLAQIIQNAQNNAYPAAVNPLTALGNYDALVMDGSDSYTAWGDHPILFNRYARTQLAYDWNYNPIELNRELDARMRLIRLAHTAGIRRVFLCVPWTRFLETANDSRDAEWRANCFQNMEEGFNWQQDRLNYQIKREGLGSFVSLVPFNKLIARIYDDIEDGIAPAALTHIRSIAANSDQTGDPLNIVLPKHGYMLNYYGTYATNCLFHRVVYGTDPRGMSNSMNGLTVPQDIATYFQNIAYEIADTPRAGRVGGVPGYKMPRISEGTPSDFIAPSRLVHHQDTAMTWTTPAAQYSAPADVAQMIVAFTYDHTQLTDAEDQYLFSSRFGSEQIRSYISMRQDGEFTIMYGGNNNVGGRSQVQMWVNGLVTRGNGQSIIIADFIAPTGVADKYGFNNSIRVIDTEAELFNEWADPTRFYLGTHNTDTRIVTTNNFNVEMPGVTVLDAIVGNSHFTDLEKYHYYRYLSKKLQVSTWEDLYPDMVV